jgi:putative membrane protein
MMVSDPRIFFAAERTLLAWVRTGLTIIALGFVVARVSLFLSLVRNSTKVSGLYPDWPSGVLGIILIVIGSMVILGALRNHLLYISSLPSNDLPKLQMPWLSSFLSLSVALVGILLAIYLFFA